MIDFIKVMYHDKEILEKIITTANWQFEKHTNSIDHNTGEILGHFAKFREIDIRTSLKQGYVKNSLHKLYNYTQNGEGHNYNDFGYNALANILDLLNNVIPGVIDMPLSQLEFGFNIKTQVSASKLLTSNILLHKYKAHNELDTFLGKGTLKRFAHSEYSLKLYDKAKQYQLNDNIIRLELRLFKCRAIKQLGIRCLRDLLQKPNLIRLNNEFKKRIQELLIIDDYFHRHDISTEDKQCLDQYTNQKYWVDLSDSLSIRGIKRKKIHFYSLLISNRLLKTKETIMELLEQKFQELLNS